MRLVVSDASTLILLTKSELILPLLSKFKLIIPKEVYNEILVGKTKQKKDAFEIDNLITQNKIQIRKPRKKTIDYLKKQTNIHLGELCAIALAKDLNLNILIDDKKGISLCIELNISFDSALSILEYLYLTKKISNKKAKISFDLLVFYGYYGQEEYKKYKKIIYGD